jgi:putative tryptophan/tyrosine transport system substrate-binding protein
MDRRAFIGSLIVGTFAMPRIAPSARKVYLIGLLGAGVTADSVGPQPRGLAARALIKGLRELGYIYGEHYVTEARAGEGKPERFPILAAELVRLQVDVIVAAGPSLPALKQATATIPVVMAAASDPVAQGLVQSLGHPGGNFTGLSHQFPETTGKRLELLKEIVPGAMTVAVLWDRHAHMSWQAADAVARERGWKLLSLEIRDADEIEGAFRSARGARVGALLVLTGQIAYPHRQRIAELAAKSRLPAMYDLRPYVEAGGLMCYSTDLIEIWRRAARFVDQILKGAQPSLLPVEQPRKFDLVINRKTANALGLTIPPSLAVQANFIDQ